MSITKLDQHHILARQELGFWCSWEEQITSTLSLTPSTCSLSLLLRAPTYISALNSEASRSKKCPLLSICIYKFVY